MSQNTNLIDYARLGYEQQARHKRYRRRIDAMPRKLRCQECGGAGKYPEDCIDGYVLYLGCGFCQGTGYVLPWMRGQWLRWKREERVQQKRADFEARTI